MAEKDVQVLCKKCGGKAAASQMKLDYDSKMFVCPACMKSKQVRAEAFAKKKEDNAIPVVKKSETSLGIPSLKSRKLDLEELSPAQIKRRCTACQYQYNYNKETGRPINCPYCNKPVGRL